MTYKQSLNKLQTEKIMWHIVQTINDEMEAGEVALADDRLIEKIQLAVSVALYEMER